MTQTRILFICHGNICRSVAAEMVFRHQIAQRGLIGQFSVASAAARHDELGNGIYPPMKAALDRRGVPCVPHRAVLTTKADYTNYDRIIGMDQENLRDMLRIYGGDPLEKLSLLNDWSGRGGEVDDPWYTRDFDGVLSEIMEGCEAVLVSLCAGGDQP